jgi:hypothetical protein
VHRFRGEHRFAEIEPRRFAAGVAVAAQIQPLRVDAGHPPARAGAPEQNAGKELHGSLMIGVHVRDDFRLGCGQSRGVAGKAQVFAFDPGDAAEPGNQMTALDFDAIKMKIGEIGIDGARGGVAR